MFAARGIYILRVPDIKLQKFASLNGIGGEIFHLFDPMETLCMVESI